MSFSQFAINENIVSALAQMNYRTPSLIQSKAIPFVLQRKDIICQAEAGTGKTLCFLVAILQLGYDLCLHQYERKRATADPVIKDESSTLPFALVLAPTRELAIQIVHILTQLLEKLFKNFEAHPEFKGNADFQFLLREHFQPHLFIGGLPVQQDRDIIKTKRCTIAVGTVGRLMQMLQEKLLNLTKVQLLVMDEADKLHENKVFAPHFQKILLQIIGKQCDQNKPQIICFSATYPSKVMLLIQKHLDHPLTIQSHDVQQLDNLKQYSYLIVKEDDKSPYQLKCEAIISIVKKLCIKQTIVFYNDKMRGENLFNDLKQEGLNPVFIHGDQNQSDRIKVMNQLKRNKANLIIATDLLSRGIDVETLDLVIHFDLPSSQETYLHRIGRTGRFGTFGISILLCFDQQPLELEPWDASKVDEINQGFIQKHQGVVPKQEYYAQFLNGVSEWKQKDYKFYDESKFQYFDPGAVKKSKVDEDDPELDEILQCQCCWEFYQQLKQLSDCLDGEFRINQ